MKTVQANFADIRDTALHNADRVCLKILARTTHVAKSKRACNLKHKNASKLRAFFRT